MQHNAGPNDKIKKLYCDSAPELIAWGTTLHVAPATATTGMPHASGGAERAVRPVEEIGRCGTVHSCLSPTWWPIASEHYGFFEGHHGCRWRFAI
jgi:hypothetical protein